MLNNTDFKRIVITGGPSTGKTAIIKNLESMGYFCFPEVSRAIILEYQEKGIPQLFIFDPEGFSDLILEGRERDFNNITSELKTQNQLYFYDRGIPDVPAYMRFKNESIPTRYANSSQNHRYDLVFVLPPWEAIYTQDNERYETYEQAVRIYEHLIATYKSYGYDFILVPTGSIKDRVDFILEKSVLL